MENTCIELLVSRFPLRETHGLAALHAVLFVSCFFCNALLMLLYFALSHCHTFLLSYCFYFPVIILCFTAQDLGFYYPFVLLHFILFFVVFFCSFFKLVSSHLCVMELLVMDDGKNCEILKKVRMKSEGPIHLKTGTTFSLRVKLVPKITSTKGLYCFLNTPHR